TDPVDAEPEAAPLALPEREPEAELGRRPVVGDVDVGERVAKPGLERLHAEPEREAPAEIEPGEGPEPGPAGELVERLVAQEGDVEPADRAQQRGVELEAARVADARQIMDWPIDAVAELAVLSDRILSAGRRRAQQRHADACRQDGAQWSLHRAVLTIRSSIQVARARGAPQGRPCGRGTRDGSARRGGGPATALHRDLEGDDPCLHGSSLYFVLGNFVDDREQVTDVDDPQALVPRDRQA